MDNELNGYLFKTKMDYNEAKDELQGIGYISHQIQNADSIQKYHVYCTIIRKELFHTIIGINYLRDLRNHLCTLPELNTKIIPPVPVPAASENTEFAKRPAKSLHIRVGIAIILILVVISNIFTIHILGNSKNLNVVNYQRRLNKMYSSKLENLNKQMKESEADIRQQDERAEELVN